GSSRQGYSSGRVRASATRSETYARTRRIAVFARVGFTRFVSRTMKRSRSGSIHIDVPVKPVWPNERRESFAPALEYPESDGVSQPSARVEPAGMFWRVVNSETVSARISCRES